MEILWCDLCLRQKAYIISTICPALGANTLLITTKIPHRAPIRIINMQAIVQSEHVIVGEKMQIHSAFYLALLWQKSIEHIAQLFKHVICSQWTFGL